MKQRADEKGQLVLIHQEHSNPLHAQYMRRRLPTGYKIMQRDVRIPCPASDYGAIKYEDEYVYLKRSPHALEGATWESIARSDLPQFKQGDLVHIPVGLIIPGEPQWHVLAMIESVTIHMYDLPYLTTRYSGSDIPAFTASFYCIDSRLKIVQPH